MSSWSIERIGDLCMPTFTYDPMSHSEEPFHYIDISSIDKNEKTIGATTQMLGKEAPSRARKKVQEGDVLVSTVRPNLNAVALVSPQLNGAIASTGFCVLRPIKNVLNNKYLFYWTQTGDFISFLMSKTTGAHYPAVSDGVVRNSKIPLPPLSEQHRIVEILDQADALRKKRAQADEKAQRILPALFYEIFGDPANNLKGWPLRRLGEPAVSSINPRFCCDHVTSDTDCSFVPMADIDEVWGRVIGKQVRKYSDVMRGFTPFHNGDVLFAKITPCMQNGKSAIASNLVNGFGFGSTEFHVLRAGPLATPEWLYSLVRLPWFRKRAEASFTGTAGQQRVPVDFLSRHEVALPPKDLQQKFAKAVSQLQTLVSHAEKNSRHLETLFSSILHRAFTGNLTEKWREGRSRKLLQEMEQQARFIKE